MTRTKTLRQVAAGIPGTTLSGDAETVISDIQYDSRLVTPGALFVALRGQYDDGHRFLDKALANGAVALAVESGEDASPAAIVCANSRQALAEIAANFYDHPSRQIDVIGITGTDGKTTTSYMVDSLFRQAGLRTGMVGTVSVKIAERIVEHEARQTTPESLDVQRYLRQMVDDECDVAILEATSHGLALHRLDQVRWHIGAVTNITHEHLELHGTIENYRAAKAILFERVVADNGTAVINLDDEGARSMLESAAGARRITYSLVDSEADLLVTVQSETLAGSDTTIRFGDGVHGARIPVPGRFNLSNAACAIAIALAHGLAVEDLCRWIGQIELPPGRLHRIDRGQSFEVLVDYAHTPESLAQILKLVRPLVEKGRVICVSGSAGERDRTKRPIQGAVSQQLADFSIFTSEDPRFEDPGIIIDEIARGAEDAGGVQGKTFEKIVDRRQALQRAFEIAQPGDLVLLAGKGHERSIIWGGNKLPWYEAEVAEELLEAMHA